jgi:hypothetical protein
MNFFCGFINSIFVSVFPNCPCMCFSSCCSHFYPPLLNLNNYIMFFRIVNKYFSSYFQTIFVPKYCITFRLYITFLQLR